MQRIAIIEDDAKDLALLENILVRYKNETGDACQISAYTSGEDFLHKYKPVFDAVFIDIELDGTMDGIATAKKLREYDEQVPIMFATSLAQYAIKGYEVNALDYFVKPLSYYAVKMRLERISRTKKTNEVMVSISYNGGAKLLPASDIYYIEVINHTLNYHTKQGNYSVRGSIREIEKMLMPAGFTRCSISYLVNLNHCNEIKGNSIMVGGDELRITRGKRKDFVYSLAAVLNGGGNS